MMYRALVAFAVIGAYTVTGATNITAHPMSRYSFRKDEIKGQQQVGPIVAPHRFLSMASGDFNGDGLDDLVVINTHDGSISILQNMGRGSFEAAATIGKIGPNSGVPYPIAVGDFYGDGRQHIAVVDKEGKIIVYFNKTPQVGNIKPLNKN